MDWRVKSCREGDQLKNCDSNPRKTTLESLAPRLERKGGKMESP